jgi:isoquinoline 1-oxidoreductase alpha subunit
MTFASLKRNNGPPANIDTQRHRFENLPASWQIESARHPDKERVMQLNVNGKSVQADVEPDMPLLWVLREHLHLTGTKFGCGVAACGACTVHIDGAAVRSCSFPVSGAAGKHITTIEAMAGDPVGKRVQAAWVKHDVPQCGYCQSGQIMTAVAFLKSQKTPPSAQQVAAAMGNNLCRCGTYARIRDAVQEAGGSHA